MKRFLASRTNWVIAILLAIPSLVLIGSYLVLTSFHGTANLFPVIVHENGNYTLWQTLFYFRHFLREIPVCIFIAAATIVAWRLTAPAEDRRHPAPSRRYHVLVGVTLALGLLLIVGGVVAEAGIRETFLNAAQFRTRDDRSAYGSHWQYHLLHLADTLPFAIGCALIIRGFQSGAQLGQPILRWHRSLGVWLAGFGILTVALAPTLRPFNDPLYLAHQAREIGTHRLLTIPLALAVLLFQERGTSLRRTPPDWRRIVGGSLMVLAATAIPLGIMWRLRSVDVLALAQKRRSLLELYAAHNFEHCLDMGFILLLTVWWVSRPSRRVSGLNPVTVSRPAHEPA